MERAGGQPAEGVRSALRRCGLPQAQLATALLAACLSLTAAVGAEPRARSSDGATPGGTAGIKRVAQPKGAAATGADAGSHGSPDGGAGYAAPAPGPAGVPAAAGGGRRNSAPLSPEDTELIKELALLEHTEMLRHFDLFEPDAEEEDDDPPPPPAKVKKR